MAWYNWSQTSATNATADTSINWAEGQSPSSVNDSARAMMAATAKYRDDIAGAIVTGGSGTAYTVTSYSVFDTLAHMNGQMIAFVPHTSNTGAATLNVDGLGAKPLRITTSLDLNIGQIIPGTPYTVTYNNSDAAFYIHNIISNPQSAIPLGACIPYFGATAPNSYFAIPLGQAVSRTTYANLFSLIGTTHGAGDGSTTFNLPDMGGRAFFGKEATATRLTTAGGGIDGGTLGAVGGQQNRTLLTANLPPYTPAGSVSATSTVTYSSFGISGASGVSLASLQGTSPAATTSQVTTTAAFTGTAQGGTSTAVQALPPGIVGNWIMRVL